MKIYIATDHAGFKHKEYLLNALSGAGYDVEDLGAKEYDPNDDYPPIIFRVAEKIQEDPDSRAIIFGGSGQGEAMVANRFVGVRCAVFYGEAKLFIKGEKKEGETEHGMEVVTLSREHNNANMLSIGARFVSPSDALFVALHWLETEFSNEERHIRRIAMIDNHT